MNEEDQSKSLKETSLVKDKDEKSPIEDVRVERKPRLVDEYASAYRDISPRRRQRYSLNDEMWDIMYPNGMDDD